MGLVMNVYTNLRCLKYYNLWSKLVIMPIIFSPVARQAALPWQEVCADKVVAGLKCYHQSMKWIRSHST